MTHVKRLAIGGALCAWAGLALATMPGSAGPPSQRTAAAARPAITASDGKEHWLSIVLDPADSHLTDRDVSSPAGTVVEADLSAEPHLAELAACGARMFWFPVAAQTPWSEIDATATRISLVKRGRDGTIEETPLALPNAESTVRRWYWGSDRVGPDGASEWRLVMNGPPCNCCDPDCLRAENNEIEQRGIGIELHARCSQPKVNWASAIALPWADPGEREQAFLNPAPYIESDASAVQAFARHWTGAAPRGKSPWLTALTLARAAAARSSLEMNVGRPQDRGTRVGAGDAMPAGYRGLRVSGAAAFASSGTGNKHDANCLAVAAMRAVGIPARVAIGFEIIRSPGGLTHAARFTTWGEFWVGTAGWVPFDCGEMRTDSLGNAPADAKIDGFGSPTNHNMRVAWSWSFDAPFSRACPRTYPAGFASGPLYRDKETMVADLGKVYPAAKDQDAIMRSQREIAAQLQERGTFGATSRSARNTRAMWPGFAGKAP